MTTFKSLTRSATSPLVLLATLSLVATTRAAEPTERLSPIFNGTNLAGWKTPNSNPFWKVADGVLVGENDEKNAGSMLWTEKAYRDFVIETEVRWSGEIDSGIMLRKPELQLQFGVSRSLKRDMTCCFYIGGQDAYPEAGRAKGVDAWLKTGDWNKIRLQAKGDTFTVWLNGQQVGNYANAKYVEAAPIGLQIHPGLKMKVEFRNIRAQALD